MEDWVTFEAATWNALIVHVNIIGIAWSHVLTLILLE